MMTPLHGTDVIVFSSQPYGACALRTTELADQLARGRRVFFFAEPIYGRTKKPTVFYTKKSGRVTVVQPYLPHADRRLLLELLTDFIREERLVHLTVWTDCAEGLSLLKALNPEASVYDKSGPVRREAELIMHVDVILTSCTSTEVILEDIMALNQDTEEHVYLPPMSNPHLTHWHPSKQLVASQYLSMTK